AEIDMVERIPEYVSHAFHVAQSGRPGPVVLALPEDMLSSSAVVEDAPKANLPLSQVSNAAVDAVIAALEQAQSPLAIVGGGGWNAKACADLAACAENRGIPVGASFRSQYYLANRLPKNVGDTA